MKNPPLPYGRRRHAASVPGAPALSARSVSAAYPGSSAHDGLALCEVSLRVPTGARVALVGPNGSGKSTLLKAVSGLLAVRSGEILVHGNPVGACRHRVAYLPQRDEIDWRFPIDVRRLVMTGRYVHLGWLQRPAVRDRKIVSEVMERLGVGEELAQRQIGRLSGGQQQRALVARALVQEADLLLLDEPLSAVDAATRAEISAVLSELQEQGKTMMIATHDIESLASEYDGALYLRDGREVEPEPGAFVGLAVGRGASWTG